MSNTTNPGTKLFTLHLNGVRTNLVCRPMAEIDAAITKVADMFSGDEIRVEAAGEMGETVPFSEIDDRDIEDNNDGEN